MIASCKKISEDNKKRPPKEFQVRKKKMRQISMFNIEFSGDNPPINDSR